MSVPGRHAPREIDQGWGARHGSIAFARERPGLRARETLDERGEAMQDARVEQAGLGLAVSVHGGGDR